LIIPESVNRLFKCELNIFFKRFINGTEISGDTGTQFIQQDKFFLIDLVDDFLKQLGLLHELVYDWVIY
jgi:hypothetical protein